MLDVALLTYRYQRILFKIISGNWIQRLETAINQLTRLVLKRFVLQILQNDFCSPRLKRSNIYPYLLLSKRSNILLYPFIIVILLENKTTFKHNNKIIYFILILWNVAVKVCLQVAGFRLIQIYYSCHCCCCYAQLEPMRANLQFLVLAKMVEFYNSI